MTSENAGTGSGSLQHLVERIKAAPGRPGMATRIIAVDGPGGAGKSTLAARLSAALDSAPVVHTDDFASWEIPLEWWPRLLAQVLEPLGQDRPARYQRYDWNARSLAEWHDLSPTRYVILEGVSASREAFRRFLSYTIWVETPREERLRRGLARDGEEARALWEAWMADEDAYVLRERPAEQADTVVDGSSPP